jgi:hypothetical protein
LVGFQAGGFCFLLLKTNVVVFHFQTHREYRTRARIPVVCGRFLELQQLCDRLIEVTETAIRRQRVERRVAVLKAKFDTQTAGVDRNTVLIERLDEEGGAFAGKMSDVEGAKQRIEVDESGKQTRMLRQQVRLRAALNEIEMKSEDLSLGLKKSTGDRAMLGTCISSAFAVV